MVDKSKLLRVCFAVSPVVVSDDMVVVGVQESGNMIIALTVFCEAMNDENDTGWFFTCGP